MLNTSLASRLIAVPFKRFVAHRYINVNSRLLSADSFAEMKTRKVNSNELPSLPVPELSSTLDRLRIAATPFAPSMEDFTQFCSLVTEFGDENKAGPKFHKLLTLKAEKTKNWLAHDWWTQKAYLEGRDSVMIWSNPAFIGPKVSNVNGKENVALFVSKMIAEAIHFKQLVQHGYSPDGDKRICNDQYMKIYGTTRIPGDLVDSINYGDINDNNYTVVLSKNNRFYEIAVPYCDLRESDNLWTLVDSLSKVVLNILKESATQQDIPIGCFSSMPRSQWAKVYQKLDEEALSAIKKCLFTVSIDHIEDEERFMENYMASIGQQVLHGDRRNIGNRWFDKTVQLIIATANNGEKVLGTGICYEHTPAEAGTVASMLDFVFSAFQNPKKSSSTGSIDLKVKNLNFIPQRNKDEIIRSTEEALNHYEEFTGSLEVDVLEFKGYGKELIKSFRLSPDSWIQVAICFAFYRLHKTFGACYETSSMRNFAFGRTDVIKSVTPSVVNFCKEPSVASLREAVEDHKRLGKDVSTGFGIDRIFFAFACIADEMKKGTWNWGQSDVNLTNEDFALLNKLLNDDIYKESKYYRLSTSQVASKYPDAFMCYGPLVKDGYGCCYNPTKNQIVFGLSAFRQDIGNTDIFKFKESLSDTLHTMNEIMLTQSKL